MSFDLSRTQSPIGGIGGIGGFLADPFFDIGGGITTPTIPKSNKPDPCLTNGALVGAIVATLILCTFIAFLTWLIYLRPKLRELQYIYVDEDRRFPSKQHMHSIPAISNSYYKQQSKRQYQDEDRKCVPLPLDVTDCKFGTFPFRHSINSSVNGHSNRNDWFSHLSCSFRSLNIDKDSEMLDIPLLDPAFTGLNFSITGNMRAGIFVKEIVNKGPSQNETRRSPLVQLKTGDRIMALTVCFESIVYEDALTILSYASPYPVILRVQRSSNQTKVTEEKEKRPATANTNKVKWRDDFETYDNDTPPSRSISQRNPPIANPTLPPVPTSLRVPPSPRKTASPKKARPHTSAQTRATSRTPTTRRSNKARTPSNHVVTTPTVTAKRTNSDIKKHRPKPNIINSNNNNNSHRIINNSTIKSSTNLTTKSSPSPVAANKKPIKSITGSVMSYLHYKGGDGEEIDVQNKREKGNNSEASMIPYYDSPYDYCYDHASPYQYLNQSHLNKNNNNSYSTESLTAITPNLAASIYTGHLSSTRSCFTFRRRRERRLSSPAILSTVVVDNKTINLIDKEESSENPDTFV